MPGPDAPEALVLDYTPPTTGIAAPLTRLPLSLTKHARTSAIGSGVTHLGGSAWGHAARVANVSTMLGMVALAGVLLRALRP